MSLRITAEYLIETPYTVEGAAAAMAADQSTGTYLRVPGETDELLRRFAARVELAETIDSRRAPSLPTQARPPNGVYSVGRVKISFAVEAVGANLPTIIATVVGNLFELRHLTGLKLLDVEFPGELASEFAGPQFGVQGTRDLVGVHVRPIIGAIIKPSIGLSPAETAELVRTIGRAGIDFIKDDELMANPPYAPLKERVAAIMPVINELAEERGRKLMYAFNISDRLEEMLQHHDTVADAGGTCVMVSLNTVGYVAVDHLRRHSRVPIHGHRNGWGLYYRQPAFGMEFAAYQKFWRLAGVDHLHVNGLQNKYCESDKSVVQSIKACLQPIFENDQAMPAVCSGQWGGQAPETYRQAETLELMYLAGAGIFGHPGGPVAGVAAVRQAWQAAALGIDLQEYAKDHEELRQSVEFYGGLEHLLS